MFISLAIFECFVDVYSKALGKYSETCFMSQSLYECIKRRWSLAGGLAVWGRGWVLYPVMQRVPERSSWAISRRSHQSRNHSAPLLAGVITSYLPPHHTTHKHTFPPFLSSPLLSPSHYPSLSSSAHSASFILLVLALLVWDLAFYFLIYDSTKKYVYLWSLLSVSGFLCVYVCVCVC